MSIGGEEARDDGQVPGVQGAEGEGVPGVLRQADCAQVDTVPGVQGAEGEGVPYQESYDRRIALR